MRNWDREAVLPESIEMKLDRSVDQAGHLRPRIGGGDAAGQVRHRGSKPCFASFITNRYRGTGVRTGACPRGRRGEGGDHAGTRGLAE